MEVISKFLDDNYTMVVRSSGGDYHCIFQHKEGLTEDGVVMFQSVKKGWSVKPITPRFNYLIVDCNVVDVLTFLNTYYNLDESNYKTIKEYVINKSIHTMDEYFTNLNGDHHQ
jgi:hypothetical protein